MLQQSEICPIPGKLMDTENKFPVLHSVVHGIKKKLMQAMLDNLYSFDHVMMVFV